jgi:hypothetical protein
MGRMVTNKIAGSKARGASISPDLTADQQYEILDRVLKPVSGLAVEEVRPTLEQLREMNRATVDLGYVGIGKGKVRTYEVGKKQYVGFIDEKTIRQVEPTITELTLSYNDMMDKVGEYANTELKWKQAEKAISDYGFAKSKAELKILNEYKAREAELADTLDGLKGPMVDSVKKYSDLLLKNTKGLEVQEREAIKDMPKEIVRDLDSLTSKLFGLKDAKSIAIDIKGLEGQISIIEQEVGKGMPPAQADSYGKLITILKLQIEDLGNELRIRYLGEGEKVDLNAKKLIMEVESLQLRLEKAVKELESFKGSSLSYDVYRKGELATQAEVVKAERDIMEAIQRTTEAIWGKESYTFILSKLNSNLDSLISLMRKAGLSTDKAVKVSFDLYDAIKREDPKALKEGIRLLQLEAGKIKDKPLQLQALEQVKLLETITAEKIMERFKATPKTPLTAEDVYKIIAETGEDQSIEIRRDAERLIKRRFEDLTRHIPTNVMRRIGMNPEEVMEYLKRTIDPDYFKNLGFDDIHDYLDVDKEIERLYQRQLERDEEYRRQQRIIETQEVERDMAKKRLDETTNPARKETLNDHIRALDRSIEKQKIALAEAEKTKVPLRETIETTKTPEERGQAITKKETGLMIIEETKEEKLRRLKSEEKAAKQIEIAKRELERESAFPGIKTSKTKGGLDVVTDYRTQTVYIINKDGSIGRYDPMTGTITTTQLGSAIQVTPAIREALRVGLQTYVQTLTQLQTKTQTKTQTQVQTQAQTATQTAVQTALQQQLKTATKLETQPITKIITETITRVVPPFERPPRVIPPELTTTGKSKVGQQKIADGSIAWKQGLFWKYIPPPWVQEKPITLKHPPKGAKTGGRTPQETVQMIGTPEARVPKSVSVHLGVVDILIDNYGQTISFTGKKKTPYKVPTTGMSIPASFPLKVYPQRVSRHNGRRRVSERAVEQAVLV